MQDITVYTFTNLTIEEDYPYRFIVRSNEFTSGRCDVMEDILLEILNTSEWVADDHIMGHPHCAFYPVVEVYCADIKYITIEDDIMGRLNAMKV